MLLHETERHYRKLLHALDPKEQHFVSEYLVCKALSTYLH